MFEQQAVLAGCFVEGGGFPSAAGGVAAAAAVGVS